MKLIIFIIQGIRTIINIFIVMFITFPPLRPLDFFGGFLLNLRAYVELRTEPIIPSIYILNL